MTTVHDFAVLRRRVGLWPAIRAKMRIALMQRLSRRGTRMRLPWNRHGLSVTVRAKTSDLQVYMQLLIRSELSGFSARAPRMILDGGSNIGLAAVELAARYPDARIVCVEPDESNVALLRENIAPFLPRVMVIQGALWSARGVLSISNPDADPWAFNVHLSDSGSIAAYSVSDIAKMAGAAAGFDMVKLDIEGAEASVFRGNLDWLDHAEIVGIELHDELVEGCSALVTSAFASGDWRTTRSGEYTIFTRHKLDATGAHKGPREA